eukprot:m.290507 g.290507  ORF g.290507 m.290507 type:complete len:69 (+) comp12309_c0_seq1:177-383(+)
MGERSFKQRLQDLWLFYLVTTGFYMLEPWERISVHTIIVALLALTIHTARIFLPLQLEHGLAAIGIDL